MRWWIALTAAVALGVVTAAADKAAGGLTQTAASRAVSMLFNAGSTWATFAILVGWLFGRPVRGSLGATAALGVATSAYYVSSISFGDRAGVGLDAITVAGGRWMVVAFVLGPVLGLVGVLTRSPVVLGAIACWVPLVGLMIEVSIRSQLGRESFEVDPWLAWTQVAMLCAASVLGVLLLRSRSSRAPIRRRTTPA